MHIRYHVPKTTLHVRSEASARLAMAGMERRPPRDFSGTVPRGRSSNHRAAAGMTALSAGILGHRLVRGRLPPFLHLHRLLLQSYSALSISMGPPVRSIRKEVVESLKKKIPVVEERLLVTGCLLSGSCGRSGRQQQMGDGLISMKLCSCSQAGLLLGRDQKRPLFCCLGAGMWDGSMGRPPAIVDRSPCAAGMTGKCSLHVLTTPTTAPVPHRSSRSAGTEARTPSCSVDRLDTSQPPWPPRPRRGARHAWSSDWGRPFWLLVPSSPPACWGLVPPSWHSPMHLSRRPSMSRSVSRRAHVQNSLAGGRVWSDR